MRMTMTWLRLELPRRWRSLAVLVLLIALATATVLTATAGARRGHTAVDRLYARTLPATVTVLPNQPGFDWNKVRALPQVAAVSRFAVADGGTVEGAPSAETAFPFLDASMGRTIERLVVLAGRMYDPRRADEVVVTPRFAATFHKHPGDRLTLDLLSVKQASTNYDDSSGRLTGPRVPVRITGVVRSPWIVDDPGISGGLLASPALWARYPANVFGTQHTVFINALIRLRGGAAAIPAFRAGLARVTGRDDIDVWNNSVNFGDQFRRVTAYEAACLLAFAVTALVTALFLVGQAIARYVSATTADLQILQTVGLTRRQGAAAAAAAPALAAVAGATIGVAGAIVASQWMPIGAAALTEPHPGIDADWLVLGIGWVLVPLLVLAASAALAARALTAGRSARATRRSVAAAAASGASLPVPVVIGSRFALEPGRGRSSVPVRPALLGAVVGVLGVLAAFTFAAGVSDAASHPERFGQTWQLGGFFGFNGQDGGHAAAALRAVAADKDVTGVDDARIAGAQSGQYSVESFTYAPVGGKATPVVMTDGRMPTARDEIVLAPVSARELHARTGSVIRLAGGGAPVTERVSGIGFVPVGPHNDYSDGGWLTPAGYDRLFAGAHYAFKYHVATVSVRPGANLTAVAHRLNAAAAKAGAPNMQFGPVDPVEELTVIRDLEVLPLALAVFLAVLAVAAIGYAVAAAVSRRRRDLAVLQALGMTRGQTRLAVATQATVLAVAGLLFGIPLGLALGRFIWRDVAGLTPLAYHPPLAVWALLLIAPAALLTVNILAVWPQWLAIRHRAGQILRTE
jgi:FtsX-like permease family protein